MLITQSENLYLEMTANLHAQREKMIGDVNSLSSSLEIIELAIQNLNRLVGRIGFTSDAEEIDFFKFMKPKFYSKKIFIVEQFNIVSNVPVDTDDRIKEYYEQEIVFLKRYFEQNQLLYQHYLNGETALDNRNFLRRNRLVVLPAVEINQFETNGDYIYAKFRAYEQLRTFLLSRVRLLHKESDEMIARFLKSENKLTWTDDKVKLVELAYGIYFMGSINEGKADISEVVNLLEQMLNIDLGVAYRKFIDISRRKSTSFTRYLDLMRESIHSHINLKHGHV